MTRRLVLDASAAVHVVLGTEYALGLVDALEATSLVLTPDLFHTEVANALWKYVRSEELTLDDAVERYEEAVALADVVHPASALTVQALTAAARHDHPVYDLLYATLARNHGCAVLTMDTRFAALLDAMGVEARCPLKK